MSGPVDGNKRDISKKRNIPFTPRKIETTLPKMKMYKEQPRSDTHSWFPEIQQQEDELLKSQGLRMKMGQQNRAIIESLAGRPGDSLSSLPMSPQQQQPPNSMPQMPMAQSPMGGGIDPKLLEQLMLMRHPGRTEAPVPYTGAD